MKNRRAASLLATAGFCIDPGVSRTGIQLEKKSVWLPLSVVTWDAFQPTDRRKIAYRRWLKMITKFVCHVNYIPM